MKARGRRDDDSAVFAGHLMADCMSGNISVPYRISMASTELSAQAFRSLLQQIRRLGELEDTLLGRGDYCRGVGRNLERT